MDLIHFIKSQFPSEFLQDILSSLESSYLYLKLVSQFTFTEIHTVAVQCFSFQLVLAAQK